MSISRVTVSGLQSNFEPSPGLGIARSIREHDSQIKLLGLDYISTSSGLHSQIFDDVIELPSWDALDLSTWISQVLATVEDGQSFFVPSLDLEVRLLAETVGFHDRILSPGPKGTGFASKPPLELAQILGMKTARHQTIQSASQVETFIRHSPEGVWLKGSHSQAHRLRNANDFKAFILQTMQIKMTESLASDGEILFDPASIFSLDECHLEDHVSGEEESIAFAARFGVLIDCVHVSKTSVNNKGKTWAGKIREVSHELRERLEIFVNTSDWHGGGEIEFVRSWSDDATLVELNPRFPAWVHGATVCGINLPAALLTGNEVRGPHAMNEGFVRVIEEIPVKDSVGIAPFKWMPNDFDESTSKNSVSISSSTRRSFFKMETSREGGIFESHELTKSNETENIWPFQLAEPTSQTPYRELLIEQFTNNINRFRKSIAGVNNTRVALSIKTAPVPEFISAAQKWGLSAECISLDELDLAARHGMSANQAILSGPAKWWPEREKVECWAFFADSIAELEMLIERIDNGFELSAEIVGLRIAPTGLRTRFGIQLGKAQLSDLLADLTNKLTEKLGAKWGIQLHIAESSIGIDRWERAAQSALRWTNHISHLIGNAPSVFDFGGGWHAADVPQIGKSIKKIISSNSALFENNPTVVFEPGKCLSETSAAVIAEVILAGGGGSEQTVIVDAALGDIPEAPFRSHPVALFRNDIWEVLPSGKGVILGRTCMEADVLRSAVDLSEVRKGDKLAFGHCGAYDLSMAYQFGRGQAMDWKTHEHEMSDLVIPFN